MEGLGLPIRYILSSARKSDRSRRTPACGAGEPGTNQFFTQPMRLSGNPFQPVLVMKSAEDRSGNNLTIVAYGQKSQTA